VGRQDVIEVTARGPAVLQEPSASRRHDIAFRFVESRAPSVGAFPVAYRALGHLETRSSQNLAGKIHRE
jgi:hypothetical protein